MARKEFTAAIRIYTQAIEADPKAAIMYTKRAAALAGSGQHSAALKDFDAAIEIDPAAVGGYLHR